ncbi:thiamine pyrophosphate-binding protein [Microbacterium sp. GXF6406]
MKIDELIGRAVARLGGAHMFGVVGSGNFRATNAALDAGVPFTGSRHEMGAACMADAFAQTTGRLSVVTVHQGCGLSNALTGIGEAAKSRTPVLVLAGDTPGGEYESNFWIDQDNVVAGMGAVPERIHSPASALRDIVRAVTTAVAGRRTVVFSMPLDFQRADATPEQIAELERLAPPAAPPAPVAAPVSVAQIAERLRTAKRPVFVGGRGAADAAPQIRRLADLAGALLTTTAVGRGLFAEDPWHLDVMGGFSTDGAAELIGDADVIVAFGAALNRWTTRDGSFIRNPYVIQVDDTAAAFGFHFPVDLEVLGDSALTAAAVADLLESEGPRAGYRSEETAVRVSESRHWSDQPFEDRSEPVDANDPDSGRIDPRALTNAIDAMVPMERVVVPDGGNFNAYPAMLLRVPDNDGYVIPLAFQSIGLALASAIGTSIAQPDRVTIAGVGDGGFMMSLAEVDTAVRMKLPLIVLVYNDHAYGAEVHHFEEETERLETVVFPETDIAAIGRGFGCEAITVRRLEDLAPLQAWLDGPRDRPFLIDAKIADFPSWVLAHSFATHE